MNGVGLMFQPIDATRETASFGLRRDCQRCALRSQAVPYGTPMRNLPPLYYATVVVSQPGTSRKDEPVCWEHVAAVVFDAARGVESPVPVPGE